MSKTEKFPHAHSDIGVKTLKRAKCDFAPTHFHSERTKIPASRAFGSSGCPSRPREREPCPGGSFVLAEPEGQNEFVLYAYTSICTYDDMYCTYIHIYIYIYINMYVALSWLVVQPIPLGFTLPLCSLRVITLKGGNWDMAT